MSQSDMLRKAAACVRAAEASSDPLVREALTYLGEFWITLADASLFLDYERISLELAAIERMQAELIGTAPTWH